MTTGAVVLFSVTTFNLSHNVVTDTINRVLFYPEYPAMKIRDFMRFSEDWILERKTLKERVEKLEMENRALSESLERKEIQKPAVSDDYIYASIVLRHPEEWWRECRIDKGAKDGIEPGNAVMSDGYLVGRVISVDESYSRVQLITSSSFMLAVTIDATRDLCILTGDDKGNIRLIYIPEDRKLYKGMTVSTSLMNDKIPPCLPIGTIFAEDCVNDGFQEVTMRAGGHMTQLYGVDVFVTSKGANK